uniref:Ig-like domain-containing protein n=1 Tax=Heterorhabditis bacteriophora TaxID=37862 RepID=A0A1I7WME9_HETBA
MSDNGVLTNADYRVPDAYSMIMDRLLLFLKFSYLVIGTSFLVILIMSHYISLLLGPPKLLVQPPEEVWYQLDEAVSPHARPTLKCHASNNAEMFVWYKNGIRLEVGGDIEWVRPSQSGTIQFIHPKIDHQGYYQCFVSNIFGTAVSNKVHLRLGGLCLKYVINKHRANSLTNCSEVIISSFQFTILHIEFSSIRLSHYLYVCLLALDLLSSRPSFLYARNPLLSAVTFGRRKELKSPNLMKDGAFNEKNTIQDHTEKLK